MFSRRIDSELTPNRLAQAVAALRASRTPFLDLTESNPTRAGFDYPADLLEPLADRRGLEYRPAPLGLAEARRAVAADYRRRGLDVPPEQIVLTASTSDAYSLLFKVLCDPGDAVLVPRPSYPLFEHLTRLDGVAAVPYDLEYHGRWSIDMSTVDAAWSHRVRAILIVSPNNPTGSRVTPAELDAVARRCAAGNAVIVADEVFADYSLSDAGVNAQSFPDDVLSIGLGGLSKTIGLPQVKLGWMAMAGPSALLGELRNRLELACDTYLSVSTPVQLAAPDLLRRGATVREQIHARVRANYRHLVTRAAGSSCVPLHADAGWYAVLQVPTYETEEDLAVNLLTRERVLVHPGYFFDFPRESYLIVSLLPAAPVFQEGIERVLRHFDCTRRGATE